MWNKRKKYPPPAYKYPDKVEGSEEPKLIWEEYKYRHEFCWNLLSRITLITTTLSVFPYVSNDFTEKGKILVTFTPFIGVLFALLGLVRLYRELKLLDRVRSLYRAFQNTIVTPELELKGTFTLEAMAYIVVLTLLSIINLILVLLNTSDFLNLLMARF